MARSDLLKKEAEGKFFQPDVSFNLLNEVKKRNK